MKNRFQQIPYVIKQKVSLNRGSIATIFQFATGQGLLQFLNLLNGFFLLRWLSIEEQAKFSLTFSIQSSLGILIDLGFGGCIIALVGNRVDNAGLIGQYISSARYFRNRLFIVSLVVGAGLFYFLMDRYSWSILNRLLLFIPLLGAVYWQSNAGYYAATLQMHKQINQLYQPQILTSISRLVINFFLYYTGLIDAVSVIWLNSLGLLMHAFYFKRFAKVWIDETQLSSVWTRREMANYLAPLIPGLLFNAVSGQLMIFLISAFGKVQNVAEVGALGRLSQLFVFLMAFNAVIVYPYFAKVSEERLFSAYIYMMVAAIGLMAPLVYLGFNQPSLFLWILGEKCKSLEVEVGWVIFTAALSYIGGVMWTIHSARKWVFWWSSILYIVIMIVVQTALIYVLDFSSTLGGVYSSFYSMLGVILVHMLVLLSKTLKSKKDERILEAC